jgi:thiol-disulfide isomerase/thioredoxin
MLKRTLLVALAASAFSFTACSKEQKLDVSVQNSPQAAGKLLVGQPFNVADNKTKVTVVQFWATWCPTCVQEMPMVQSWYDINKAKGLNLVSISIDDKKQEVTDWLAKNTSYTQPYAWVGEVQHNFGRIKGTPTFVVIGKDGTVVKSFVGGIKQAELDSIAQLL